MRPCLGANSPQGSLPGRTIVETEVAEIVDGGVRNVNAHSMNT
jgi:hypothetical protein